MTTPHPPVDELRPLVKRVPEDGALLGAGTHAIPFEKDGLLLDFIIRQGIADGPMSHGGATFQEFNILTKEEQPFAGGIKVKGKRFTKNLYLLDDKGEELACMKEETNKDTVILSTRPFFPGQELSPYKVGNESMYLWYKITTTGTFGMGLATIQVATKKGLVPAYETHVHSSHEELAEKHAAPKMSIQQVGGRCVALIKNSKRTDVMHGTSREAVVAPGMDPCLVICIVVNHDHKPRSLN